MTRDTSRLEQDLNAALEPGERFLWTGFPRRGVIFHARDIFLIPLSLVWLCLAISWEVFLFTGETDVPDEFNIWDIGFVIWGIPFVLAGLYFVFGRFVTDAWARANTVYGLSDRRILILQNGWRRKLRTLELSGLREMHLTEGRNGRGTIGFGPAFYGQASVGTGGAAFHGIPAARDVLQQIRDAKAQRADLNQEHTMEKATFGAGCFWGVEHFFAEVPGVIDAVSGYEGGHLERPTYRQVCSGATDHAEVVEVTFDPVKVSYAKLVDLFFKMHDPTQMNRQGPDSGTQYRSAIFTHSPDQARVAREEIETAKASGRYARPIVTVIEPAQTFWKAEDYHQDYFEKNQGHSCHVTYAELEHQ